jgi:hypothetical protein
MIGGRGSSVGIASRYGLDMQGFESLSGKGVFSSPNPSTTALGPAQSSLKMGTSDLSPG